MYESQGLKARGNVEDWLCKVEEAMFASVKRSMKFALKDYMLRPRVEWVELHPNQVSGVEYPFIHYSNQLPYMRKSIYRRLRLRLNVLQGMLICCV